MSVLFKIKLASKIKKIQPISTTFWQTTGKVFIPHVFLIQACLTFHKLTLTILNFFHAKHRPKIIQYRDFNCFDNASFRADLLLQELSFQNIHPGQFEKFKYISLKVLKVCVRYFLSNFYFSPDGSPSKTMKNVFHFI